MDASIDDAGPSVFFRRPKSKKTTVMRKREEEPQKSESDNGESDGNDADDFEDEDNYGSIAKRKRHLRQKNVTFTTNKKRQTQLSRLNDSSSSDDSTEGGLRETVADVKFKSSGTAELSGPRDMGATARSEIDTEYDKDAQAQFERVQQMLQQKGADAVETATSSSSSNVKVYRGMALYGAKEKQDTVKGNASSGLNRIGPIRATQYMRSSVRWDYAPDICKDYKETGFCTFGDSCKFMHDRSDYKHGWQLEKEWEEGKFKESKEDEYLVSEEDDDSDEDNVPFNCYICRKPFRNPVVAKCKHYFCEMCALKRYRRVKKCAVCDQKLDGHFSIAKKILERMAAKKSRKNDDEEGEEGEEKVETKVLPMEEPNEGDGATSGKEDAEEDGENK